MVIKLLVVAAVLATVAQPAAGEHKPQPVVPADFTVKAGAHKPGDKLAPWTYTKFYPSNLTVHRGQTVKWEFENSFAGLHTVYFEADEQGYDAFTEGEDPPDAMRQDELPGWAALNETGWIQGSEQGIHGKAPCGRAGAVSFEGRPAQPPCTFGAGDTVSSGMSDQFFTAYRGPNDPRGYAPFAPFVMRFDSSLQNNSFRYVCKYHPGMEGTITVVDDDVPLKTQEQIDQDVAAEIAADTAIGQQYWDEHNQVKPPVINEDGEREWRVEVGGVTAGGEVNFIHYFPSALPDARLGDVVRFEVIGDEWQTVTFPTETVGGLSFLGECLGAECTGAAIPWGEFLLTFHWGCEIDDPRTGFPQFPIHVPTRGGCPAPTKIEWIFGENTMFGQPAPGDVVSTPATRHNSGLMLANDMPDWARTHPTDRWPHEFTARFVTPGTFNFTCLIHPQAMKGTVTVS